MTGAAVLKTVIIYAYTHRTVLQLTITMSAAKKR